jgi:hypothetical protein
MSTPSQLSPLEQLTQAPPQQAPAASSSDLSPLEQLAQSAELTQAAPATSPTTLLGETIGAPSPGASPAGKLSGLPGVHPHTPSLAEGASDVALASSPLAAIAPSEAVNAGERLLQMTESQLQKFAEAYPHLSKIAAHLGLSATPVGIYELLTHWGGKK